MKIMRTWQSKIRGRQTAQILQRQTRQTLQNMVAKEKLDIASRIFSSYHVRNDIYMQKFHVSVTMNLYTIFLQNLLSATLAFLDSPTYVRSLSTHGISVHRGIWTTE